MANPIPLRTLLFTFISVALISTSCLAQTLVGDIGQDPAGSNVFPVKQEGNSNAVVFRYTNADGNLVWYRSEADNSPNVLFAPGLPAAGTQIFNEVLIDDVLYVSYGLRDTVRVFAVNPNQADTPELLLEQRRILTRPGSGLLVQGADGAVYFTSNRFVGEDRQTSLFRTDGTAAGTVDLGVLLQGLVTDMVASGDQLYFIGNRFNGNARFGEFLGRRAIPTGSPIVLANATELAGTSGITAFYGLTATDTGVMALLNDGNSDTRITRISNDATAVDLEVIPNSTDIQQTIDFNKNQVFFEGRYYFIAETDSVGRELFVTTQERDSTTVLKEFFEEDRGAVFTDLQVVGDRIVGFFDGDRTRFGFRLFVSDGTPAGTVDLNPGFVTYGRVAGSRIVNIGDNLYLALDTRNEGSELYAYNKQTGQIALIEDYAAGDSDGVGRVLGAIHNQLYLSAALPEAGLEPATVDVTAAAFTPALLIDLNPSTSGSNPRDYFRFGGAQYVVATPGTAVGEELVRVAGNGSIEVFDLAAGPAGSSVSTQRLVRENDVFFYADTLSSRGSRGRTLYKITGDTVINVVPNVAIRFPGDSQEGILTEFGGRVLFTADIDRSGYELYATNGDRGDYELLLDAIPGTSDSNPAGALVLGDRLYFSARLPEGGRGTYSTDGTAAGTRLERADLALVVPEKGLRRFASSVVIDGTAYFTAISTTDGLGLYRATGNLDNAERIELEGTFSFGSSFLMLPYAGGLLVGTTRSGGEITIHQVPVDGATAGTVLVSFFAFDRDYPGVWQDGVHIIGDQLYFRGDARGGASGYVRIPVAGGIAVSVSDDAGGRFNRRRPQAGVVANDTLMFIANNTDGQPSLYQLTNPTDLSGMAVVVPEATEFITIGNLAWRAPFVYFAAADGRIGLEPYRILRGEAPNDPVSVGETPGVHSLSTTMYPVPAREQLTVAIDEPGTYLERVVIYDISGRQLRTTLADKATSLQIFVGDLPRTTLVVQIQTGDGRSISRLAVLR